MRQKERVLVGLALLVALIAAAPVVHWAAIGFTASCDGVLLVVVVWEWGSFHGGWRERFRRRVDKRAMAR